MQVKNICEQKNAIKRKKMKLPTIDITKPRTFEEPEFQNEREFSGEDLSMRSMSSGSFDYQQMIFSRNDSEPLLVEYDPRARKKFAKYISSIKPKLLYAKLYNLPINYECSLRDLDVVFHTFLLLWQKHKKPSYFKLRQRDMRRSRPFTTELRIAFMNVFPSNHVVRISDIIEWVNKGYLTEYLSRKMYISSSQTHDYANLISNMDKTKLRFFLVRICKRHLQDNDTEERLSFLLYKSIHYYLRKSKSLHEIRPDPAHWRFSKDLATQCFDFFEKDRIRLDDVITWVHSGALMRQYSQPSTRAEQRFGFNDADAYIGSSNPQVLDSNTTSWAQALFFSSNFFGGVVA